MHGESSRWRGRHRQAREARALPGETLGRNDSPTPHLHRACRWRITPHSFDCIETDAAKWQPNCCRELFLNPHRQFFVKQAHMRIAPGDAAESASKLVYGRLGFQSNEKRFRKFRRVSHVANLQPNSRPSDATQKFFGRLCAPAKAERQMRFENGRVELFCENPNQGVKQFALWLCRDQPVNDGGFLWHLDEGCAKRRKMSIFPVSPAVCASNPSGNV
jgi:hypothetical protein